MSGTARLEASACVVVVVDVQEKLAAAMPADQLAEVARAATILLEGCAALGARVIVTEQYPKGLGPTIAPLAERAAALGAKPLAKMTFSACDDPAFQAALTAAEARAVIVVGMETHVCVYQTVRDLAARGVHVLVPADGVASRRADHRAIGLDLCRAAGATITTAETIAFDWLREAGTEPFKRLSRVIR